MSDPVTANKAFAQPTRNSDIGVWDVPLNGNTTYLDALMGSLDTLALSSTDVTLTIGTESNYLGYILTGTLLTDITISFPAIGGMFIISNQTTGDYTATINTTAAGSTGVIVPQGFTQLIYLDGTNGWPLAPAPNVIPSGTIMPFFQASAPTGWTQVVTYNDYALRIVSGTGGVVNGNVGLSAFISGGTAATTLTTAQVPSLTYTVNDPGHAHSVTIPTNGSNYYFGASGSPGNVLLSASGSYTTSKAITGISVSDNAGGGSHNHALQNLQYLDFILASKN